MEAPSKTRFGFPDVLSTIAGMRPFATAVQHNHPYAVSESCSRSKSNRRKYFSESLGCHEDTSIYLRLIFKNQFSFCTLLVMSTLWTLYLMPSSSRVMDIFCPFGVPEVYLGNYEVQIQCRTANRVPTHRSMSIFEAIFAKHVQVEETFTSYQGFFH